MAEFVTLSCPTCGGKLKITNDIDRFACSHCGNEHVVKRSGGIVSLSPVVDGLKKIKTGVDKRERERKMGQVARERMDDMERQRSKELAALQNEKSRIESEMARHRRILEQLCRQRL